MATHLENTGLMIFFYFPLKISILLEFFHSLLFCLWNLKLHSYRFVDCKHGQVTGWNESWNWPSHPDMEMHWYRKGESYFFLAPYLAHRCMNVSLAPGPCALSLDKAPCFLSLIQTGLLCLQNSQYFPESGKPGRGLELGAQNLKPYALLEFLLCQVPGMEPWTHAVSLILKVFNYKMMQ